MKTTVTASEVVDLLNEMLRIDPIATRYLFSQRSQCNETLANHPTIQVREDEVLKTCTLGFLGVLNGLFGVDAGGYGPICLVHEQGRPYVIREFALTPPDTMRND